MMFHDVPGRLVVALPVSCTESAPGGRFMGGQEHAKSVKTEYAPLCNCARVCSAQIPPGGGQAEQTLPRCEILDARSCGQFEPDNCRSRALPLQI